MSPELKQFYKDLHHWVTTGENPEGAWFSESFGICTNLCLWADDKELDSDALDAELAMSFHRSGLNDSFPFDAGIIEYSDCSNKYTNPARLEWIARHAQGV